MAIADLGFMTERKRVAGKKARKFGFDNSSRQERPLQEGDAVTIEDSD